MAEDLQFPGLPDESPPATPSLVEQAQAAVDEAKAEVAAWRPSPVAKPRQLAKEFGIERVDHFQVPAPFAAYWFDMRANASEAEINSAVPAFTRPDNTFDMYGYLAHFCSKWSLRYDDGSEVPITGENMTLLPGRVGIWLQEEWGARRRAPLVPPKSPTSATEREPHLIGGPTTSSPNGTG